MRSQIAKHVVYIANSNIEKYFKGFPELKDGSFFIVQRSVKFYSLYKIQELNIALRTNTILGSHEVNNQDSKEYYVKHLTTIIPQKDFYSFYGQHSFYVYSHQLDTEKYNLKLRGKYYDMLERVFVFVVKELLKDGEESFNKKYTYMKNDDLLLLICY